jgi:hypothetical protein
MITKNNARVGHGRKSGHKANDYVFRLPSFVNIPRVWWYVNPETAGWRSV